MYEHLHVNVSLLFENVKPVYAYFSEAFPNFDDCVLIMRVPGLVLEVGLPLFHLSGVYFTPVLVLHVVVLVGVYECHYHVVLLGQLHLEAGGEVGVESVGLGQLVGLGQFVDFVEELQTVGEEALADVDDAHLLGLIVQVLVLDCLEV